MSSFIKKMCIAAILTALCTLATTFISIPTGMVGNINLGDCICFAACMLLGLWYGPAVGALGGGIADLLSGYAVYCPVTVVAKGLMGIVLCVIMGKKYSFLRAVLGMVLGGACMVLCYFFYEWALYGFAAALPNVAFNFVQTGINAVLVAALYPIIKKTSKVRREH
ncbi:MAG: ECF transporter S component [Clostridia bacterium]|nr:ECF transporter S component [Clostridia bacterium]